MRLGRVEGFAILGGAFVCGKCFVLGLVLYRSLRNKSRIMMNFTNLLTSQSCEVTFVYERLFVLLKKEQAPKIVSNQSRLWTTTVAKWTANVQHSSKNVVKGDGT